MYEVMIIDDDQSIRDRLKKIIDWEGIGISMVCEAQDSDAARELFLLYHPKIVITDINIPIMSGLELANEMAAVDPDVRFIIITGYSDFEYVRASVKLGAVDLISKPILADDINGSLKKAVEYFTKIKAEQASLIDMKQLLAESLPIYRERFADYLLHQTSGYSESEIRQKFRSIGLDVSGRYYALALVLPSFENIPASETEPIFVKTKNTADETLLAAGYRVYSFFDNKYRLNCLLGWDDEKSGELLEDAILKVREKILLFWDIPVSAGISIPFRDLTKLHIAFQEARIALNYQGILAGEPIINYLNIKRMNIPVITDKTKVITGILNAFKSGDLKSMDAMIKNELGGMVASSKYSTQAIRKFCFDLISSIVNESISLGVKTEIIFKYYDTCGKVLALENVQFLPKSIAEFAESIAAEIVRKESESKNMLIQMSKDFILQHLGDENLDLEMVSRHVGLSSIYFCKLFHKEEGVSFNDYLNIQRVNKAKNLLRETNMKVFEIGYASGYGNPKYFNYVFKRVSGVTPLEFRNSLH